MHLPGYLTIRILPLTGKHLSNLFTNLTPIEKSCFIAIQILGDLFKIKVIFTPATIFTINSLHLLGYIKFRPTLEIPQQFIKK